MKIENRENVKGKSKVVVFFNNERYFRLQKDIEGGEPIVQWKKSKTNHIVNADKFKFLEEKFEIAKAGGKVISVNSSITSTPIPYSMNKKAIDDKIKELLKNGSLLMAVKYYKDTSGLGLKESKEYVDAINVIYQAEKKWEKGMELTRQYSEKEQMALRSCYSSFTSIAQKDAFVFEIRKIYTGNNALTVVKTIKDKTGWGLYECKVFFDFNIK